MSNTIKNINNIETLANTLVPEEFILNAPQFYDLIKAFLVHLQDVQDSIDSKFLDTIDISKINNIEIKRLYIDTYLGMMNLQDVDNLDGLNDLVRASRELSTLKGTALLYELLSSLLVYVVPTIGTEYNNIYQQYLDATGSEKQELENQLEQLRIANLDKGATSISDVYSEGDLVPFKYKIESNYEKEDFYKYIYSFAHPSGWEAEFSTVLYRILVELVEVKEATTIFDVMLYPIAPADGSVDYLNTNDAYPDNVIEDPILGLEADLSTISSSIYNTDRLYIDNGNVKYRYHNWNGEVQIGTTEKYNTDLEIRTPADDYMVITGGGYRANTTGIASANGTLDAGDVMIAYQIFINDKEG